MLNFPIPYPDELLYSSVARAGVHMGITSPKRLLDVVYGNRKVIATVDLPCYIERLSENYPKALCFSPERLVYQHTLFPLYAPFVNEIRRLSCLEWMVRKSQGAVHLTLGAVASRIKQPRILRYCPRCMEDQLESYGEYFWARRWQVVGADCCLQHGVLLNTEVERHAYHRHQFIAASPQYCKPVEQTDSDYLDERITRQVIDLLDLGPITSPSFKQWTVYYRKLVCQSGCERGKQIQYQRIKTKAVDHWSANWLRLHKLDVHDGQSCWLRTIFRKQRKSFSYLEHIVVLDAFLPAGWCIGDVLKKVTSIPIQQELNRMYTADYPVIGSSRNKIQERWLRLICNSSINECRQSNGATYAWLYRHDRDWLLRVNLLHKRSYVSVNNRVDWDGRDRDAVYQLTLIHDAALLDFDTPRRSKCWFLSRLKHPTRVEKNINKLPLANLFFEKHCESTSGYQIRRIVRVMNRSETRGFLRSRWRILRLAGLSEERLENQTKVFLQKELGLNAEI